MLFFMFVVIVVLFFILVIVVLFLNGNRTFSIDSVMSDSEVCVEKIEIFAEVVA